MYFAGLAEKPFGLTLFYQDVVVALFALAQSDPVPHEEAAIHHQLNVPYALLIDGQAPLLNYTPTLALALNQATLYHEVDDIDAGLQALAIY